MAKDSKTILLFTEQRDAIAYLTDEEAGQMFKAIYDYAEDGVVPKFAGPMMSVFAMIRSQIDRSRDAYKEKCLKNSALILIPKKIQILTLMMELTLPSSMMWK